jgi:V/A-type H+-transporting ATPase subunit A
LLGELLTEGKILNINASILVVGSYSNFSLLEMVLIGEKKLIGEVININQDNAVVQVFEDTTGLKLFDRVYPTGRLLSIELGPGLIGNILDGMGRSLNIFEKKTGTFISSGVDITSFDKNKLWETKIISKLGDKVSTGDIIAQVQETGSVINKIMIPENISGKIIEIVSDGNYDSNKVLAVVENDDKQKFKITMTQLWPVKIPRRSLERKPIDRPLITGQRIIDTLFPIGKGGIAAVPGGFGTGKTMTQHQLAKWSDADIIVYIGCGERGNEMTQVLEDFSGLKDPRTGNFLLERTVLIANTSNMPVAAREASIYTGVTIAEYYRDMGYHVAIMADSTSRWAEALRELSGRLEEMPAEEGFPAYLASRLAEFYERAGYVKNLNKTEGSISIIGAVSPQGGDFSEPVTQNTKRFVRCFWALNKNLAYARHFPAIDWLISYSEYLDDLSNWYETNIDKKFIKDRRELLKILNQESELTEIVKLIGADVLPDNQKLVLQIAKVIRLGFIQQNAYHNFDTYVSLAKQFKMMEVILYLYDKSRDLVSKNIAVNDLISSGVYEKIISMKYEIPNDDIKKFDEYFSLVDDFYNKYNET